jgi:hypothetical protein
MKSAVIHVGEATFASQLSLGARFYMRYLTLNDYRSSSQCARSASMVSHLLISLLVSMLSISSLSTAEHQAYFLILKATSADSPAYVAERVRSLVNCVTLDQRNKC